MLQDKLAKESTQTSIRPLLGRRRSLLPWLLGSLMLVLSPWFLSLEALEKDPPKPFPRMALAVGEIVNRFYYDQSRIDPQVMLERSLRALEAAEISLQAILDDRQLTLRAKGGEVSLDLVPATNLMAVMQILDQIRTALPEVGFTANRTRELAYQMLNGALSSLDPHTVIMPPQRASEFSEDIAGEFFGVGAYLNQELGVIRIERVMPGLPAEQAGIQDGDIILAVDGEPTVGLSLAQAVSRIRGPKGTEVVLTVEREGSDESIDIPTIRDLIEPPTLVSWQRDGIGYVRLDEFNRNSNRQLYVALSGLINQGEIKALVLDLRFNGGGLLRQAHMIADMFLPHSREVVRTVGQGRPPQILQSGRNQILGGVPLVVLVGPSSASASEILAGALQHNDRAVVAGAATYGKGSVQTVRPLTDDSNFKFTIQEYQLKDGISIQGQGVQPDLALLRRAVDEAGDVDLIPYTLSAEADLEFALHGSTPLVDRGPVLTLPWLADHETEETARRSRISARNYIPDQEARLVIDLLAEVVTMPEFAQSMAQAWLEDSMREVTAQFLATAVQQREQAETARLADALAAMEPSITWGHPNEIEDGALKMEFIGPQQVTPGEAVSLQFRVRNLSDQDIGHLYGMVRADTASPLWESELIVGNVPAQGETVAHMTFTPPQRLYAGHEAFTLELRQDGRKEPVLSLPVAIQVRDQGRPHFSWSWQILDSEGLQPSPLLLGQPRRLRIRITNDGTAASLPLMVYAFKDDDPFVSLEQGRFQLDPIAAGAHAEIDVPFTILSVPPRGYRQRQPPQRVTIQLHGEEDVERGVDGRYRERFVHSLDLTIGEEGQAQPTLLAGQVTKPLLSLKGIDYKGDQAHLHFHVEDDNLRDLAVFSGDRKIFVKHMDGSPISETFTLPVTLGEGLNEVRILSDDGDEIISMLPLRLWGPEITLVDRPGVGQPLATSSDHE